MTLKRISAYAAAIALAAGTVLAVAPGAQAARSSEDTTEQNGLQQFQSRHGLTPTGRVDAATGRALSQASDTELVDTFRTAQDLGPEQRKNARIVIGVGKGANFPKKGIHIALMAAMQESKFVNYTKPVDHDSLGIFQQRPSQGWGSPEQITHVPTSSKSFYGVAKFGSNPGLKQIPNWRNRPNGEVCQAIQRSAYPDRYAQWLGFARDFYDANAGSVQPIP